MTSDAHSSTVEEPDWDALVPEVTLRPQQYEALSLIWRAFYADEARVVILEAPTGVGKSIIQLALCRYEWSRMSRSYIVTPQRVLQDQMRGWDGLRVMKGKGSYECPLMQGTYANTAPCNITPDIREEHPECQVGTCPYFTALEAAKASPTVVHNYASLMAQSHIGRHFTTRGLLCLDEGHTAVGWIRNYLSCEFEPVDLVSLTDERPPRNPRYFMPWLRWVLMRMDEDEELPPGLTDRMKINLMKMYSHRAGFGIVSEGILRHRFREDPKGRPSFESFAKNELIESATVPWTTLWIEPDQWHPDGQWSTIPLKVAPMSGCLTNLGTRVLIVTATSLDMRLMSLELGLKDLEPVEVTLSSAFPAESRPIRKRFVGKMSYRYRRATMPKLIAELVKIASRHASEPGMIHTVSHALSWDVSEALRAALGGRIVERLPRGGEREAVIHAFLSGALGPNAILVGPSLMEGVDGAGGSCRWQAMCKVPYPHMKDPVVEFLMGTLPKRWSNAWYSWKTAQQTVQGIGRVCRSTDDFGVTYLLDSGFSRIIGGGYVPDYVREAIV
jgi:Rad3-related DNA helicase